MPDGTIRFRDNRAALVEIPVLDCPDLAVAQAALTDAIGVPVAVSPGAVARTPLMDRAPGRLAGRPARRPR